MHVRVLCALNLPLLSALFVLLPNKVALEIDPAAPRFVVGDPTRMHQLVLNLISNAGQ